jgi:hypothetical protein
MERTPPAGPHPVRESPVFRHARSALTALVDGVMDASPAFVFLWLLAMEELARDFDTPFTASLDDPEEQASMDHLRTGFKQGGVSAFARLLEQMRRLRPEEAAMFGQFLEEHVAALLLTHLGRISLEPGWLTVEHIRPGAPEKAIRIVHEGERGALVFVPYEHTRRELLDVATYLRAHRPTQKRGPRRKAPLTPRTRRRERHNPEALRAWTFVQEHPKATLDTVARFLWPEAPMTSEAQRRKQRAKARRRINRGRILASRAEAPERTKIVPPEKSGTT